MNGEEQKGFPQAFDLDRYTIFQCVAGSRAFGTSGPDSDEDLRGIVIAPQELLYSPFWSFSGHDEHSDERDLVLYELRKFMKLAAVSNPSIIELLWIPKDCLRVTTHWSDMLMQRRRDFLSIAAKSRFIGYASQQLHKLRLKRDYMKNPPEERPVREDFPNSKSYKQAADKWRSFVAWRDGRSSTRQELEERFGYDTKHAAHLVRLLRMGWEIVTEGSVNVRRADAEELRKLRFEGAWSFEDLEGYADEMMRKMDEFVEQGRSPLPEKPDLCALNELCCEITADFYKTKGIAI